MNSRKQKWIDNLNFMSKKIYVIDKQKKTDNTYLSIQTYKQLDRQID